LFRYLRQIEIISPVQPETANHLWFLSIYSPSMEIFLWGGNHESLPDPAKASHVKFEPNN